ncbi:hypothetical protein [Neopusillimonas aromaticivorans]|uniref:hypothetical protein n=1 Tax=Neopusillimonas aromaticivorans TaxID=2979868 RepID=UPI0025980EDB|nr:hypothetical protein [Neopusillimonas aromaticivorans]WJJ92705.1 hypothetical protein N7E01_10300 [Neopusillimonas aromaticivorans]
MMNRLSEATLGQLPLAVPRPNYDRAAIGARIVHLGAGAFFAVTWRCMPMSF